MHNEASVLAIKIGKIENDFLSRLILFRSTSPLCIGHVTSRPMA